MGQLETTFFYKIAFIYLHMNCVPLHAIIAFYNTESNRPMSLLSLETKNVVHITTYLLLEGSKIIANNHSQSDRSLLAWKYRFVRNSSTKSAIKFSLCIRIHISTLKEMSRKAEPSVM
jgi:hypothetical protein